MSEREVILILAGRVKGDEYPRDTVGCGPENKVPSIAVVGSNGAVAESNDTVVEANEAVGEANEAVDEANGDWQPQVTAFSPVRSLVVVK